MEKLFPAFLCIAAAALPAAALPAAWDDHSSALLSEASLPDEQGQGQGHIVDRDASSFDLAREAAKIDGRLLSLAANLGDDTGERNVAALQEALGAHLLNDSAAQGEKPRQGPPGHSGIFVAESRIPGANRGIFAARDIAEGETIDRSQYIELPKETVAGNLLGRYVFGSNRDPSRALLIISGHGSLFNHAGEHASVAYRESDERPPLASIDFYADRPIKSGEELTINYGYDPAALMNTYPTVGLQEKPPPPKGKPPPPQKNPPPKPTPGKPPPVIVKQPPPQGKPPPGDMLKRMAMKISAELKNPPVPAAIAKAEAELPPRVVQSPVMVLIVLLLSAFDHCGSKGVLSHSGQPWPQPRDRVTATHPHPVPPCPVRRAVRVRSKAGSTDRLRPERGRALHPCCGRAMRPSAEVISAFVKC